MYILNFSVAYINAAVCGDRQKTERENQLMAMVIFLDNY